jgi:hypothetical protein
MERLGWIPLTSHLLALGADQVAAFEKSVADQITESKTPTTKTGKPF